MEGPRHHSRVRTGLQLFLLIILLLVLITSAAEVLPPSVGSSDFIGYWTGARLLLRGEDPYDPESILQLQQEVSPAFRLPMFTWNPPWLVVLLLPLGALPFPQATTAWLVMNVLLIGAAGLAVWWLFDGTGSSSRLWLALPLAFLFPQTLTALDTGQISTLVLVGIVGFLVGCRTERWLLAGAFLALTTVKPHLVFLWLPLVLAWTMRGRRWRVWPGFGLTLTIWLMVLTGLRPSWLLDYAAVLRSQFVSWATPTLSSVIALVLGADWIRYLGLLLVPVAVLVGWKWQHIPLERLTAASLPVSLSLAGFGWSYDQILLLLPLIAMGVILSSGELSLRDTTIAAVLYGLTVVALFVQRISFVNEVQYVWVPWAVMFIGLWVIARRKGGKPLPVVPDANVTEIVRLR